MWLDELEERFADQLTRARSLVDAFDGLYSDRGGAGVPTTTEMDVLRAAVVMCHAALEEVVRIGQENLLQLAAAEVLNDLPIPLVRAGADRAVEKVRLGTLVEHFRGQDIAAVVRAAVDRRCERSNFNHPGELIAGMAEVGAETNGLLGEDGGFIAALMSRRHQIAHRADRNPARGRGRRRVRPLSKPVVVSWIAAIERVGGRMIAQLRILGDRPPRCLTTPLCLPPPSPPSRLSPERRWRNFRTAFERRCGRSRRAKTTAWRFGPCTRRGLGNTTRSW